MKFSEARDTRILIVDDHPIVRQGLSMMINREPGLSVCQEASSAEEALNSCRAAPFDLAIVDLSLSGISGLELVRQLRSQYSDMLILIMSMHDESTHAERCLQAGANGYLMKQEATDIILVAIRHILKGELYLSEAMRTRLIHQRLQGQSNSDPITSLSSSEYEIFTQLGAGLSVTEIAQLRNRSPSTIESHRANIKNKLNISSNTELAIFAFCAGSEKHRPESLK